MIDFIPFDPGDGIMPGYAAGLCGHKVALQEWAAGFRTCEHCPDLDEPSDAAVIADAIEYLNGATLAGSLTRMRAADILADWPRRTEIHEAHVLLIVALYPDPDDDYRQQVSHR